MKFINRWLHNRNEVYITLMVILIIVVLSLAIFANNSFFVQYITSGTKEIAYPVVSMENEGYEFDGKMVTAVTQNALLSQEGVNRTVSRIQINCINELSDSNAISSFAYSTIANPTTFTTIPFSIIADDAMLKLENQIPIANIEMSLTNKVNDSVICENIVLNPAPRLYLSAGRIALYIGIILLSSIVLTLCPDDTLTKMGTRLSKYSRWIFVGLLVVIDLLYPIIVTWDSGHYLWLADMFKTGELANWDPIRNAAYPFSLFLTNFLFGQSQNAYLIPMIIAHCAFYLLCCELLFRVIRLEGVGRLWVTFAIFVFIAIDPTVVGYYHTLLTEYVASLVAVMSCLIAFDFYVSDIRSKKFYWTIIYFCIFIPLMWHVKQPYIGAALFPFMISSALKILKHRKKSLTWIVIIAYLAVIFLTVSSQAAWTGLLENAGNLIDESRQLSTWGERSIENQTDLIKQSPMVYLNSVIENYLTSSNYYAVSGSVGKKAITKIPSLTRGYQNKVIAQKIFELDTTTHNLFYSPPYYKYFSFLKFSGETPQILDNYFASRTYISNLFFTSGYMLLPFYLVLSIMLWFKKKSLSKGVVIVLIGTALINAIAHSTFTKLDRYLFYGYPLLLLAFIIELVNLSRYFYKKTV